MVFISTNHNNIFNNPMSDTASILSDDNELLQNLLLSGGLTDNILRHYEQIDTDMHLQYKNGLENGIPQENDMLTQYVAMMQNNTPTTNDNNHKTSNVETNTFVLNYFSPVYIPKSSQTAVTTSTPSNHTEQQQQQPQIQQQKQQQQNWALSPAYFSLTKLSEFYHHIANI